MNRLHAMRPIICGLLASFLLGCSTPEISEPEYSFPAEWETHEAVWFTYAGAVMDSVLDQVVMAMDSTTLVVCATDYEELAASIRARFDSLGIARSRYRMEVMGDSLYVPAVRDVAPSFCGSAMERWPCWMPVGTTMAITTT